MMAFTDEKGWCIQRQEDDGKIGETTSEYEIFRTPCSKLSLHTVYWVIRLWNDTTHIQQISLDSNRAVRTQDG